MNVPSDETNGRISNEKLKEFEGRISIKDNNYKPSENVVEENIFNKGGKQVESIIDSSFDFLFDIVKGFIDEK